MQRSRFLVLLASLAIGALAVGYAASSLGSRAGLSAPEALIGGPFELTGAGGKPVRDTDFRGRLMLVFFGYTHCPDVCPTELQTMTDALAKLGPSAKGVASIFISVDPQRDTPDVMSAYTKLFGQDIVGLTGTREQVAHAAKAYRVYYRAAKGESADTYPVDHSAFIYLMGRDGRYLTHFAFNTPPDAMAATIMKYAAGNAGA